MRKIILASVAVLAFAGIASAADLPSKRTSAVAYAPAVGIWTGFYAGAHAGWSFGETTATLLSTLASQKLDDGSFSGGALVGYNHQINQFVVGVESDITAFDLKDTVSPISASSKWLGTIRARLGYSVDRFLPFITAGVAFSDSKAGLGVLNQSKNRTGYALGAGVDYAFTNNIIGRVEYQYTKFDATTYATLNSKSEYDISAVRAAVIYKF